MSTQYMKRCLELAQMGKGLVSPNPMVGCVLVKNDRIIGEGYHRQYGGPHAEVEAVNAVKDDKDIEGATAYVSLEPCSHFGKTPPCSQLLIEKKVAKVVICNRDPFKEVDGKGIEKLKENGIEVEVGVLEKEGKDLNKAFFTFHTQKRPYVVLKWAESADGFIAPDKQDTGNITKISNPWAHQWVHKYRSELDAILVGKNTWLKDRPSLNTRHFAGKSPIRIVLDSHLNCLETLATSNNNEPCLLINEQKTDIISDTLHCLQSSMTPKNVLEILHEQQIQSVLIEGGSRVLKSFIEAGLWDETHVFVSRNKLKPGVKAPQLSQWSQRQITTVGNNQLMSYKND